MFRKTLITAATLATALTALSTMTATSASAWYDGAGYGYGYGSGYGYHAYVPHCWQQPIYGYDAYGVRIIIGYRHVCR